MLLSRDTRQESICAGKYSPFARVEKKPDGFYRTDVAPLVNGLGLAAFQRFPSEAAAVQA